VGFIEGAEAEDDQTIVLQLAAPTALLKDRLALVRIAPRAIFDQKKPDRVFNSEPIGSGPYRITSISRNLREVRFAKHGGYRGPEPFRTTIKDAGFEFITEDQPRAAAVETGRLHAALDPPFRGIERLESAPDLSAGGVPSFNQSLLLFNCKKKPFDDPRVRRALLHAIDRDSITEAVFFGKARPAVSYLPEDHPDFKEPATSVEYDPDRAKQLLSEAGVPDLKFEMLISNLGWLTPQAPLIQGHLRDIGVDMKITPGQIEAQVNRVTAGDYEVWLSLTDPTVFGSTDGPFLIRWIYGNLAAGFLYWTNSEAKRLLSLLDESERTPSRERVKELAGEMQDIINEEAPSFPLHHREAIGTWSTGLELELDPTYGMTLMQARKAA
jgi:peptide/nickel transport system substrate-binding protein